MSNNANGDAAKGRATLALIQYFVKWKPRANDFETLLDSSLHSPIRSVREKSEPN